MIYEKETHIHPMGDMVLIRIDDPVEKIGSLFIPQSHEEVRCKGLVVAVAPAPFIKVKPGDRVHFERELGYRFHLSDVDTRDGKSYTVSTEYVMVSYMDILGCESVS